MTSDHNIPYRIKIISSIGATLNHCTDRWFKYIIIPIYVITACYRCTIIR